MADTSKASPGPAPDHADHHDNHPELAERNARLGLWLFLVYSLLYAGFIGLCCFAPELIRSRPLGGTNLAIHYGFALIAAAFMMALLYMYFCKRNTDDHLEKRAQKAADVEEPENPASPV